MTKILNNRFYKSLEGQIVYVNVIGLEDDVKKDKLVIYTDGYTAKSTITKEEIFKKKFNLLEKKK